MPSQPTVAPIEETPSAEPSVRNDVTIMEQTSASLDDLKAKIVQLTKQLTEVEGAKKSANRGFNDEIKDIKNEIKLTLDLIKEAESHG